MFLFFKSAHTKLHEDISPGAIFSLTVGGWHDWSLQAPFWQQGAMRHLVTTSLLIAKRGSSLDTEILFPPDKARPCFRRIRDERRRWRNRFFSGAQFLTAHILTNDKG